LLGIIRPFAKMECCTMISGDFFRPVGATGIHYDDFVGDSAQRIQRTGQIVFFVQRDQTGGEAVHGAGVTDRPPKYRTIAIGRGLLPARCGSIGV
jgi:hypothetical protein